MEHERRLAETEVLTQYMMSEPCRKLHIGCGHQLIYGWLNTDSRPRYLEVITLDATRRFDFEDDTFDYIFSQHMIEHVSFTDANTMLAECFRVLKPGGVLRVSTPDLAFLIDLYRCERSELQDRYMRWAKSSFIKDVTICNPALIINNFVRAWGHQFIYDEETLRYSMNAAGFRGIERRPLNESPHKPLAMLENTTRMPEGFLQLETFTLEGLKSE